jgi:protein arginine N-methyltransferase 1
MHQLMLADHRRNRSLRLAIERAVRPGDIVIDVGTGTGLLAMFAARAGASKVYALEHGPVSFIARRLVEVNSMQDVIEVIQTPSLRFIPPEQADVVVSETLGFAVLDERFRENVVDARDRMLRPGGVLIPRSVRICAAPVEGVRLPDGQKALERIEGLDFGPFAAMCANLHERRHIAETTYLSSHELVFELDCNTMSVVDLVQGEAAFAIVRDGELGGFALWFDASLGDDLLMSSQHGGAENHWGQTFLPIQPVQVEQGETVCLQLSMDDRNGRFVLKWESSREMSPDRPWRAVSSPSRHQVI